MVDPRRLHVPGNDDPRTGDPEQDLAALLAGRWNGFVWGHGLADGLPHEVPAAAAFPALRGVRPGRESPGAGYEPHASYEPPAGYKPPAGYEPPAGVAAGYDWAEAVGNGLIARCRWLTLGEITARRRPFTPIAWSEVALDARGDRYRSLVEVLGQRVEVHDVTGSPGVPTLGFSLDGVTVAYASGFTFADALRDGLAEVLLSYQAAADGEAAIGPARVPPLPERDSRVGACPAWSTDEAATAARLARLGWAAVAVPLDHDPGVVADIMPYLVNVVLTRA